MKKLILLLILLLNFNSLYSQGKLEEFYGFFIQSWVNDDQIILSNGHETTKISIKNAEKISISIDKSIISESELKEKIRSGSFSFINFPTYPFFCNQSFFYNYYQDEINENTKENKNLTIVKIKENNQWSQIVSYYFKSNRHRPLIFPLKNGKWFILNADGMKDGFGKQINSFFFIGKANEKGVLEYVDHYETGLGKLYENFFILNAISGPSPKIFTEDFVVICVERYGLFWSISLENGQVQGPVKLFPRLSDDAILKNEVLRPVINLQPRKDGTILVATRPEEAVLAGSDTIRLLRSYSNQMLSGIQPENALQVAKASARMEEDVYLKFPFVSWFELTPRTLGFKRLSPPPFGAKEMIHSAQEFRDFTWIVDANDDVRFLKKGFPEFQEEARPRSPKTSEGKPVPRVP